MSDATRVYARIFVRTAPLFGVLLAGYFVILGGGAGGAVLVGVVGGLLFGAIMALLLGTISIRSVRRIGGESATNAPVRQQLTTVLIAEPIAVFEAVDHLIQGSGARVSQRDVTAGRIDARTGFSWKSWGERLSATVLSLGDGRTEVRIESRPRFPGTAVDYGKNLQNVRQLDEGLKALFPGRGPGTAI
ncbi:hypothetical protein [Nocardia sp. NPDC057668]|uniref:hypothetical protein n=1 Tax=Nocardia sp. NPDC057668 TaxID=3346202 RepID=UPI0036711645